MRLEPASQASKLPRSSTAHQGLQASTQAPAKEPPKWEIKKKRKKVNPQGDRTWQHKGGNKLLYHYARIIFAIIWALRPCGPNPAFSAARETQLPAPPLKKKTSHACLQLPAARNKQNEI